MSTPCVTPGCNRQHYTFGNRCCAGCANPSRDGVVVHTERCNCDESERRTQAEGAARQPREEFNPGASLPQMPRKRHEAAIQISQEQLKAVLNIPPAWNLIGAKHDPFQGSTVTLLFSHPDLYPVHEGCVAPVITATYNLPDPGPVVQRYRPSAARARLARANSAHDYSEGTPI